jgi:hypothetical protein
LPRPIERAAAQAVLAVQSRRGSGRAAHDGRKRDRIAIVVMEVCVGDEVSFAGVVWPRRRDNQTDHRLTSTRTVGRIASYLRKLWCPRQDSNLRRVLARWQTVCWVHAIPVSARREPAAEFPATSGDHQIQRSDLGFPARPSQLEPTSAQEFSFASSRSGVRISLAPVETTLSTSQSATTRRPTTNEHAFVVS